MDPDANILFGSVIDESLGDEIMVTVIATGFNNDGIDHGGVDTTHDKLSNEISKETPMINADDTAYQKIDKKNRLSAFELINRRHSIETANPPSSYFDKESNEIQHKSTHHRSQQCHRWNKRYLQMT